MLHSSPQLCLSFYQTSCNAVQLHIRTEQTGTVLLLLRHIIISATCCGSSCAVEPPDWQSHLSAFSAANFHPSISS